MKRSIKNNLKNNENGKELFKLLGELDEDMVEDAWAEHGEEVIIMEQSSPFRFVKIAAGIAAAILVVGGGVYGFNRFRNGLGYSPAVSIDQVSGDEISEELSMPEPEGSEPYSKISVPEISEPQVIEPFDEPTVFTGFANDQIMSSDVTRTNTEKKPSEIMPEDIGTIVWCDGFCYFKEPLGVAYDSYHDPELFIYTGNPDKTDGNSFYGEMPQNINPWRRLYEGDEMCGLTLKKATTQFKINVPEEGWKIEIGTEDETLIEFEGTIEIEGILCVDAPNLSNDGGSFRFYPTEDKLPILGGSRKTIMDYRIGYAHETGAVHTVNEYPYIKIERAFASYDEIGGIDKGDAVLASVTLSNISYYSATFVSADIEAVEILSEPIAHVDEWMQK